MFRITCFCSNSRNRNLMQKLPIHSINSFVEAPVFTGCIEGQHRRMRRSHEHFRDCRWKLSIGLCRELGSRLNLYAEGEYVINPSLLSRPHPVLLSLYNPYILLQIHFFVNFWQVNIDTTMKRTQFSVLLAIFLQTVLVVAKVRKKSLFTLFNLKNTL